jgi:hypothetical protein
VRINEQTLGIPRAHAGRGDVCDQRSGGRVRLSGQPERSCVLATTTVWPMKCERVKRCLVGGGSKERLVWLNSWVFGHVRGVSWGSKRRFKEVEVMRFGHVVLISYNWVDCCLIDSDKKCTQVKWHEMRMRAWFPE